MTQIMGRTEKHRIDDWVRERKGTQARGNRFHSAHKETGSR